MSLLLDALKRAELAKQEQGQSSAKTAPTAATPTVSPVGAAPKTSPTVMPAATGAAPKLSATASPSAPNEPAKPVAAAAAGSGIGLMPLEPKRVATVGNTRDFTQAEAAAQSASTPAPEKYSAQTPNRPTLPTHSPVAATSAAATATPPRAGPRALDQGNARPGGKPATEAARAAIKNMFAAKQAQPLGGGAKFSKPFLITLGVLALIGGIGGGYVWWEIQPAPSFVNPDTLARIRQQPPSPPTVVARATQLPPASATPAAPASGKPPATPSAATSAANPPAQTSAGKKNEKTSAGAPSAPAHKNQATPARKPRPAQTAKAPVASPESQAAADEAPIRVGVTARSSVDPALNRAWVAFNGNNLAAAQKAYQEALRVDPNNADALHGVAAIAIRQGRLDEAEAAYNQALSADPKDAVAIAGLAGLAANPQGTETLLKNRIAAQPNQPPLYFALGNVYAATNRWNEAQQAYFNAVSGDVSQPDYLYNLGVSLEHLHQPTLAQRYYADALKASGNRAASFDAERVKARIQQLQNAAQ